MSTIIVGVNDNTPELPSCQGRTTFVAGAESPPDPGMDGRLIDDRVPWRSSVFVRFRILQMTRGIPRS